MAVAFRAKSALNYASRGSPMTVTKPTGTAADDILIAHAAMGQTDADVGGTVISPPDGTWTAIRAVTVASDTGTFNVALWGWWKRAGGSEPASYDFTQNAGSNRSTEVVISAYSGCLASGTPIDTGISTNSGTGTAGTALSITTTVANTLLVIIDQNWEASGTAHVPPSGFTERHELLTTINDAAQASAGASGNKTFTSGSASGNPWQAWMFALKPAGLAAYSVTATAGSYALTGTNATLTLNTPNKRVTAVAGSYALTGTAATLTKAGAGGSVPVFRAAANTTYAQRSILTTVNKPTGTVDGDIMVASLFMHTSVLAEIVLDGVPSGWTQIGTTTSVTADATNHARMWVYWKRASSEGASYDFLHDNTLFTQASIVSYSGCIVTGSPVDVFSQNSANTGSTATATGVTTTSANTKLLYTGHNFDNSQTLTPPSGMTERFDGIVYQSDEDRASAGATGNRTQTLAASNPWQAYLVALKPAAGATSYSVTAAPGSYALTGTPATLRPTGRLTAVAGAYTITGTPTPIFHLTGGIPVFRAISSTAYVRADTTVVDKPTGTVNGDIMILSFFAVAPVEADVRLDFPPAGWTQIFTEQLSGPDAGVYGRLWVYWKRASGEGANFTLSHSTTIFTQATIASYSGCIPTGNPVHVFTAAGAITATAIASSVTTTVANTKLIYTGHNWEGSATLTPPTGMTERFDGLLYYADQDNAATGATGSRSQTLTGIQPWQAYTLALLPPGITAPFAFPPINPAAFLPFLVR